jgi:type VI secretion system protein ImpK
VADFDDSARKAGFSAALVEESRYALCAWLDERVFYFSPISFEWLAHSLVVREFQDQAAGSNFFERLQRLHQKGEFQPAMEIYADCILLGFRGKYRIEEASRLETIVDEILGKKSEPGWKDRPWFRARLREPGKRPKERTGRRLLWLAAGVGAFAVFVYLLLAFLAQQLS